MHKLLPIVAFAILPYIFANPTPVIIWHGMGDSSLGMNSLKREIENEITGIHVKSVQIGNNIIEDILNGFLMHPDDQIDLVCKMIQSDPLLNDGYNAIGLSQGSQFLRALAQRCTTPKMKTLISIGGQHQGVYGIPMCNPDFILCDSIRPIITELAYGKLQTAVTQATYWHESVNETAYFNGNSFLVDINNEVNINEQYVNAIQALEKMVLVLFEDDVMVIPLESQWFGFYKPGQGHVVETLQESRVYTRLGLDKLDSEGKIDFLSIPGRHLQFSIEWFRESIIKVYLK